MQDPSGRTRTRGRTPATLVPMTPGPVDLDSPGGRELLARMDAVDDLPGAPTLSIEINDPRPDCHLKLSCGELDVSLGVSNSTVIVGVLPAWDDLAGKVWEDNLYLELHEVPGADNAALAELDDALAKAAAPFVPMIRQLIMSYLGMVQDEYRAEVDALAARPVPVLVEGPAEDEDEVTILGDAVVGAIAARGAR